MPGIRTSSFSKSPTEAGYASWELNRIARCQSIEAERFMFRALRFPFFRLFGCALGTPLVAGLVVEGNRTAHRVAFDLAREGQSYGIAVVIDSVGKNNVLTLDCSGKRNVSSRTLGGAGQLF